MARLPSRRDRAHPPSSSQTTSGGPGADGRWWVEVADAARAERAARRDVATDLHTLVDVAEVLAGTLARVTLGAAPALATVTATLIADKPLGDRLLKARPASPPTVHGEGPTRELVTRIELVDGDDRLVGDVQFVWRVDEADR